jgi:hypothetical protein
MDRDRGHLQPGHPPLAAPVNQGQVRLVQPHAEPRQKTPGFLHRERQVPVPQLDQVLVGPHPVHPQRRVNPAGHHQLQRRRVILHQPAQGVGAGRAGQVKVVDDQHPRSVQHLKVAGQGSDRIGRYLTIEAHQLAGTSCGWPKPWRAGSTMAATNRAGSASAASQLSHADGRSGRAASQSASSMVFPAPAGPTSRARRTCSPRSSWSSSRDRRTSCGTSFGARNFEDRNRGLRGPGSATTVACETAVPASPTYPPGLRVRERHEASPGRFEMILPLGGREPYCVLTACPPGIPKDLGLSLQPPPVQVSRAAW